MAEKDNVFRPFSSNIDDINKRPVMQQFMQNAGALGLQDGVSAADLLREQFSTPQLQFDSPKIGSVKAPSLGGSDTFEFGMNKGTFDLASAGIGSISDLMKTFLGFKTLALGKDQLQTNKDQFNQNFAQQTAAANDRRLQYNQTNDAKRRFIQGNSANKDTSFLRDLVPA